MRSKSENPVLDSGNYTFVSARTLQNTFPTIVQIESAAQQMLEPTEPESDMTAQGFTNAPKRVSRRISEPAA